VARFRIIVEGANLFFTQEARLQLEEAGVVLYKDASANKVNQHCLHCYIILFFSKCSFTRFDTNRVA